MADPQPTFLQQKRLLSGGAFLLCMGFGNKKTLPKAEFFVEHVQESVLVSTLKRCFSLLTQIQPKSLQTWLVVRLASLVTVTVPVLSAGCCMGSLAAGSVLRSRTVGRCYAVMPNNHRVMFSGWVELVAACSGRLRVRAWPCLSPWPGESLAPSTAESDPDWRNKHGSGFVLGRRVVRAASRHSVLSEQSHFAVGWGRVHPQPRSVPFDLD